MDHEEKDPDTLDEAAIRRIMSCLGPEQARVTNVLQLAAIGYRAETRKVTASLGRGTKLELKRLAAQMNAAATALESATLQTLVFADVLDTSLLSKRSGLLKRAKKAQMELRYLQNVFEDAVVLRRKSVPDLDVPMSLALSLLRQAYGFAVSKAPTHSATRDGEYIGRPLSEFGRFVVAFFAEVDRSRTERSLATSIRKHLASQKQH